MIKFSVVIPIYNSALFVSKTIKSILKQSYKADEIIVVDDGSTDNSCEIVLEIINRNKNFNIKLIEGIHKGPGSARNIGIKNASNKWIAFLDSDDLWYENKLNSVSNYIIKNKQYTFFCHNENMMVNGSIKKYLNYSKYFDIDKNFNKQLYKQNLFSTSAVVCLKNDLIKVGGFDENLSSAQDYDLWLKMSDYIKPFLIDEILGIYTVRKGNISSQKFLKRLKNILKVKLRHRSKGGSFFFIELFKTLAYYTMKPIIQLIKFLKN